MATQDIIEKYQSAIIQIATPFNIDLEFEIAEFHKRLFAYIIDFSRSVNSPEKRVAWKAAFLQNSQVAPDSGSNKKRMRSGTSFLALVQYRTEL